MNCPATRPCPHCTGWHDCQHNPEVWAKTDRLRETPPATPAPAAAGEAGEDAYRMLEVVDFSLYDCEQAPEHAYSHIRYLLEKLDASRAALESTYQLAAGLQQELAEANQAHAGAVAEWKQHAKEAERLLTERNNFRTGYERLKKQEADTAMIFRLMIRRTPAWLDDETLNLPAGAKEHMYWLAGLAYPSTTDAAAEPGEGREAEETNKALHELYQVASKQCNTPAK